MTAEGAVERRELLRSGVLLAWLLLAAFVGVLWVLAWTLYYGSKRVSLPAFTDCVIELAAFARRPAGTLLGLVVLVCATLLPASVGPPAVTRSMRWKLALLPIGVALVVGAAVQIPTLPVGPLVLDASGRSPFETELMKLVGLMLLPGLALEACLLALLARDWLRLVRHVLAQPTSTAGREALHAAVLALPVAAVLAPFAMYLAPASEPTGLLLVTPGLAATGCLLLVAWGVALLYRLRRNPVNSTAPAP